MTSTVILFYVASVLAPVALGCSFVKYTVMSMEARIYRFDLVVTGTDIRHVIGEYAHVNYTDSEFQVSCVLKGDNREIKQNITIERVYPINTCQGTEMEEGKSYIIGLQRSGANYIWHEVNELQTVAFDLTMENLNRTLKVCGLQNPVPPSGINDTSACPKFQLNEPCSDGQQRLEAQVALVWLLITVQVFSFVLSGS